MTNQNQIVIDCFKGKDGWTWRPEGLCACPHEYKTKALNAESAVNWAEKNGYTHICLRGDGVGTNARDLGIEGVKVTVLRGDYYGENRGRKVGTKVIGGRCV